ncbi:unnamed protein product [Aureobasidium vineae]|uniref:Uncharacterized protein n=1 Tax=Aureobasidium vineae TaxID=2773715 RepID=A0A9N8JI48_9PEZI|nr:unnamed protein product [Aureobasidium vineae]
MRWFKDHPKEISAGGNFPPPFAPVAAAAWPPPPSSPPPPAPVPPSPVQSVEEPKPGSEEEHQPKRRSWFKRALGLGEITPPRPSTYMYDLRETGRVFDNQGREITGLVDEKGRPIVPKPTPVPKPDRSTASRRPRAEPITSHWTAEMGVGGPGGGFVPPKGRKPAGEGERRRETDSSGTNKALDDAPM